MRERNLLYLLYTMKILQRLSSILLLAIFALVSIVPGALAQTTDTTLVAPTFNRFVNVEQLNVRSEPYMDLTGGNVIGILKSGDVVTVQSTVTVDTTQWCEIDYQNYPKAYVDCQYLSVSSPAQKVVVKGSVNVDSLRVRSQTRKSDDNVLGVLEKDTVVTVKNWRTDLKVPWCEIEYNDYENAFVVCRYLTIQTLVPEPVIDIPDPGYYQSAKVLVDLNVRSSAEVPGPEDPSNIIGSVVKDTIVQVKSENIVPGLWCEIVYKEYDHAYVDCGYLEKV